MTTTIEHARAQTHAEQPAPPDRAGGLASLVAIGAVALAGVAVWRSVGGGSLEALAAGLDVVWALVAGVLVARGERHGILVAGGAALGALGIAFDSVAPFAAGLLPATAAHLLLSMPDGRLTGTGRRVSAGILYAAGIAAGAWMWSARPNPPLWPLVGMIVAAAVVGGLPALAKFRTASGTGRKRIEWLSWAVVVGAGIAVVAGGIHALVDWPRRADLVAAGATVVLPLSLLAASSGRLRHSIDRVLAATISLAGLTVVVIGVYLAIVLGLGRVPRHNERTLLVLSMAAAAVAAVIYLPTHSRLKAFATRIVYGERQAPDDVIRNFGSRLSRAIPLDELLLQMTESLRKTLGLSSAEVWRGSGGTLERSISDPELPPAKTTLTGQEEQTVARAGVSGPAWAKVWLSGILAGREDANLRVAPITHSGELLGLVVVERPPDSEPFDTEEETTLADLARQVGLTLHNVRLDSALQESLDEVRRQAHALQESRARVVAAGDRERRRIERNLHDGAQQHLVALAVKVRLVRQLADRDAGRATSMLEELASDVEEALQELRDLAHGIYPPLLADKGLPEALASAARRSPLPMTVDAAGVGRYPADLEAAVYFCCLEALQNAGKYAGEDATVAVRVWEEAGGLLFEVADDGAGFDVQHRGVGSGFTGMSDRLGSIGGTLRIESAPGRGTKVRGTIPLEVEAAR